MILVDEHVAFACGSPWGMGSWEMDDGEPVYGYAPEGIAPSKFSPDTEVNTVAELVAWATARDAEFKSAARWRRRWYDMWTEVALGVALATLGDVYAAIKSNVLVRDTSLDHEPGWSLRAAPMVLAVAHARAILAALEAPDA